MKIIAIIGTYRKNKFIDQIISEILNPIYDQNHEVEKIYLIDTKIEFCNNCRTCMNSVPEDEIGKCVHNDEMAELIKKICQADALILATPTNIGSVTAIMKRFIERTAVTAYWPWQKAMAPKPRLKPTNKKAIVITSSAMPGALLEILSPGVLRILKYTAKYLGYGKIKKDAFGLVGFKGTFEPLPSQLRRANKLGEDLIK